MPLHGLTDTRHSAAVTHAAFHAAVAPRQGTITRVSHYPTRKVNLKPMAAIRCRQAGGELGDDGHEPGGALIAVGEESRVRAGGQRGEVNREYLRVAHLVKEGRGVADEDLLLLRREIIPGPWAEDGLDELARASLRVPCLQA